MHHWRLLILTSGTALLATVAATPVVMRLSRGFIDRERAEPGDTGPIPVPRLGGVAVLVGALAGIGLPLWLTGYSGTLLGAARYHWIGWLGAVIALFLCGVVDDIRGLGPFTKLAIQTAGALAVFAAGFRVEFVRLPWGGVLDLGLLALPLTILWIVGVTNAINLIDGLDGLAAGVAFMSAATVVAISYFQGVFPVTVISVALAGSLLGFLAFNFSPARIWLGDSGSQFLGFTLAVISIRGLQKSATAVAILAPILVLGVPILDTLLVVLRRGWRIHRAGRTGPAATGAAARWLGLFHADREHIHYNLLDLGLSHRKAVVVLYATAAVFCLAAFGLVTERQPLLAVLLAAAAALEMAGVKLLAVWKRGEAAPRRGRARRSTLLRPQR